MESLAVGSADAIPERLTKSDPDFKAIRYYIKHKRHQPGIGHSKRVLVKKQARKYDISADGKLIYVIGKRWLEWVENQQERLRILRETHL